MPPTFAFGPRGDKKSPERDPDSYSVSTQLTSSTAFSFASSLPSQLTRKTCRKGFTFNIMSVGQPGIGKTTLLSCLFNKNLEIPRKEKLTSFNDIPVEVNSKTFEIEDKGIKLKLSVVDCINYGAPLNLTDSFKPIVDYIDQQFVEYHKRESGFNRREIHDTIIHCLFFFVSALGHGLQELDLQFLSAVHEKVNIVPLIAKADALTLDERKAFKRKMLSDLNNRDIKIYQIPDPDPEDDDDFKRDVHDIKNAVPFAVISMCKQKDTFIDRCYDWGTIDLESLEHSDYVLLKAMLHMNMSDLRDKTFEYFYENYRVKMLRMSHKG